MRGPPPPSPGSPSLRSAEALLTYRHVPSTCEIHRRPRHHGGVVRRVEAGGLSRTSPRYPRPRGRGVARGGGDSLRMSRCYCHPIFTPTKPSSAGGDRQGGVEQRVELPLHSMGSSVAPLHPAGSPPLRLTRPAAPFALPRTQGRLASPFHGKKRRRKWMGEEETGGRGGEAGKGTIAGAFRGEARFAARAP